MTWAVWCSHEKVKQGAWSVLLSGLSQGAAVDEMVHRQDRVRRSKQPCRFKVLPEGEQP